MRAIFTRPRCDRGLTLHAATLRAAVLVSCLAAGALSAPATWAQSRDADARPCTEIDNDTERLACYDRSLRPSRPAPAPAAAAAPAAPVAGAQPPREVRNATPAAAPVAPVAPAAATAQPAKKNESFNLPPEPVVIVNVRGQPGRSVFTSETGEVFMQTDDRNAFLPKLPFRAEVKQGFAGSFFLVPAEGRAIRVKRGP